MLINISNFATYEIVQFSRHSGDICLRSRSNNDLTIWLSDLPPELFASLLELLPKAMLCYEMTSDARFIPYNPLDLGITPDPKFTHTKPNIGEAGTDYIPSPLEDAPDPFVDAAEKVALSRLRKF